MTASTRDVVEALYAAYLAGDLDAMLALCHEDVEVRFLGQGTFHGRREAHAFMSGAASQLDELEFEVERIVVDGDVGAGIWRERAVSATGAPWINHGVDVVHVRDGRIVRLHENNDVRAVHDQPPRGPEETT
jgi:uncharacterized protein